MAKIIFIILSLICFTQKVAASAQSQKTVRDTWESYSPKHRPKRQIYPDYGKWQDAIVPFEIEQSVEKARRIAVFQAMLELEAVTCLRFKQKTTESDYVHFTKNGASGECYSSVGRNYGGQELTLNCLDWVPSARGAVGLVLHEIGHALGFAHEHERPDRDQYITISDHHFPIDPSIKTKYPYDAMSVMHYPSLNLSGATKKDGSKIEGNDHLTKQDIHRINTEYECSSKMNRPSDLKSIFGSKMPEEYWNPTNQPFPFDPTKEPDENCHDWGLCPVHFGLCHAEDGFRDKTDLCPVTCGVCKPKETRYPTKF